MKLFRSIFLFLVAGLFIAGCSSNPSESEGKAVAEKQLGEQSQGKIKIVDFEKVDGQEGEFMGVKVYSMDVEYEVEFTAPCEWNSFTGFASLPGLSNKQFKAGERAKFSASIQFGKTENGWQGQLSTQKLLSE